MPKFSIITVCYNEAAHIRETLDSIVNQTFKDHQKYYRSIREVYHMVVFRARSWDLQWHEQGCQSRHRQICHFYEWR